MYGREWKTTETDKNTFSNSIFMRSFARHFSNSVRRFFRTTEANLYSHSIEKLLKYGNRFQIDIADEREKVVCPSPVPRKSPAPKRKPKRARIGMVSALIYLPKKHTQNRRAGVSRCGCRVPRISEESIPIIIMYFLWFCVCTVCIPFPLVQTGVSFWM